MTKEELDAILASGAKITLQIPPSPYDSKGFQEMLKMTAEWAYKKGFEAGLYEAKRRTYYR